LWSLRILCFCSTRGKMRPRYRGFAWSRDYRNKFKFFAIVTWPCKVSITEYISYILYMIYTEYIYDIYSVPLLKIWNAGVDSHAIAVLDAFLRILLKWKHIVRTLVNLLFFQTQSYVPKCCKMRKIQYARYANSVFFSITWGSSTHLVKTSART
jgi:hypothetical protein